ncbi:MAG: PQQ-binding-like beta-propeller repeat protein [Candidatus Altiarchaeota archaeon]
MKIGKTLLSTALLVFVLALIQHASASTLDPMFNYSIVGSLDERIDVQRLEVVDIDNSGIPEILVITTGSGGTANTELKNRVYLFNANGSIRWRHSVDREILTSFLKDINNDRKIDTIVASGITLENTPRGTIQVIDHDGSATREFTRNSIIMTIYVDDMNNDKYYELITGSKAKVSLLYIDGERIWDYPSQGGGLLNTSVYSVSTIDLENDKVKEVVYGSSGVYLLNNMGSQITGYELDTNLDLLKRKVKYVSSALLFGHGQPDILAATDGSNTIYALEITKLDYKIDMYDQKLYSGTLEQKWTYGFYNTINEIKPYDLDGDKLDEILTTNEDGNLYVIDSTGSLLWSFRLDGPAKGLLITDTEGEGEKNIVIESNSGSIYALDTKGNFLWRHDTNLQLEKISAGDIDGDGMNEFAVTTSSPELYVFKLNKTLLQKAKADEMYSEGERLYIASSFEEAREVLVKAMNMYGLLSLDLDVTKAQSLISRIDSKLSEDKRKLADVYYEKAQDYYISGDYKSSEKYVNMSKEIYSEFGDSENILRCELLQLRLGTINGHTTLPVTTTEAKNETSKPSGGGINLSYILLFVIVVIVLLALVAYVKKKREEQKIEAPKEPWEKDLLSKLDKDQDPNAGGGEDEA